MSWLMNWFYGSVDDIKKKDDDYKEKRGGSASASAQIAREPPPVQRPRTSPAFFFGDYTVPVKFALNDSVKRQSRALQCEDVSVADIEAMERKNDERDCVIMLDDLMNSNKGFATTSEVLTTKFENGHALVIELVLQVEDENWDPNTCYLRIQVNDIVPLQQSLLILGDRTTILDRALNPRPAGQKQQQRECPLNQHRTVPGWCIRCGSRPTSITLHQTPLDDGDLSRFIVEALAPTGTHGHVKAVLPNTRPSDISEKLTGQPQSVARLELNTNSAIANQVCKDGGALYVPTGAGSIFMAQEKWESSLSICTQRVLFNLPLASLRRAQIRVGARHDGTMIDVKLKFRIAAQCLGIHE